MTDVHVVEEAQLPWMKFRGDLPEEVYEEEDLERNGGVRILHPGTDAQPSLKEVRIAADADVAPHRHESDEILYVTGGHLRFDDRVLTAGDSLLVPANAVYGFRTGPEGVRLLVFRVRRDRSHRKVKP